MRIRMDGGDARVSARIATALAGHGFVMAGPDDGCDLTLTLARPAVFRHGGLSLDAMARRAWLDGRPLRLTPIEWRLLERLAEGAASRADLLYAVWGYGHDPGTNLVAVHLCRLRAKLGTGHVVHDRDGYRLRDAVLATPA